MTEVAARPQADTRRREEMPIKDMDKMVAPLLHRKLLLKVQGLGRQRGRLERADQCCCSLWRKRLGDRGEGFTTWREDHHKAFLSPSKSWSG